MLTRSVLCCSIAGQPLPLTSWALSCALGEWGKRARGVSIAFDAIKRKLQYVCHISRTSCLMLGEPCLVAQDGRTPLLMAARNGQLDCVMLLLNISANVHAANKVSKG